MGGFCVAADEERAKDGYESGGLPSQDDEEEVLQQAAERQERQAAERQRQMHASREAVNVPPAGNAGNACLRPPC